MKSKRVVCGGGIVAMVWGLILMAPLSSSAGTLRIDKVDYKEKGIHSMWSESDRRWKPGLPQVTGIISSRDDFNGSTYLHVYFFDIDKKPVGEIKKVTCTESVGKDGWDYGFDSPNKLTRRTDVLFMFAVPQSLVDQKWDRAIVVFGTDTEAVAEAEPRARIEDYDFPEKELVLKTQK